MNTFMTENEEKLAQFPIENEQIEQTEGIEVAPEDLDDETAEDLDEADLDEAEDLDLEDDEA